MKLNYKRTILVGFAFFLICAFWQAYDNTIPLILTNKFGMSQTWSGVIMALDNVLALFLLPLFGHISDKCTHPKGRRTPFIVVGTLLAAVALIALSFVDNAQLKHLDKVSAIDDPAALAEIYQEQKDATLLTPGGESFILGQKITQGEFTAIRSQITEGESTVTNPDYTNYVVPARQACAHAVTRTHPGTVVLFVVLLLIILARRWYLYFVVGYYFVYALLTLAGCLGLARAGEKAAALNRLKNLILFGLASVVAMVILLWPMVHHILTYNYGDRYSYYNAGGALTELPLHLYRLGLFNLILMGMGFRLARRRKQSFLLWLAAGQVLVSLLLFTRVQNTGSHQFLLFLPGYFILFLLGAAALAEGIERRRNLKLGCWAFVLVFSMSVRCSPMTTLALPGYFIDHPLVTFEATRELNEKDHLIYDRKDIGQIRAIADWIDTHCDEGELCYMIPHDMLYNPDHFKNCRLPETPINNKLAFGFSVPGTHNFPMQFFEAKYVITADPFPLTYPGSGEMSGRLNDRFLAVRDQYFTFEKSFDMGNGTTFTIWKRTTAPTREEVEYYLSAFAEEDAQYPEMFSQVAEAWLTAHGL